MSKYSFSDMRRMCEEAQASNLCQSKFVLISLAPLTPSCSVPSFCTRNTTRKTRLSLAYTLYIAQDLDHVC